MDHWVWITGKPGEAPNINSKRKALAPLATLDDAGVLVWRLELETEINRLLIGAYRDAPSVADTVTLAAHLAITTAHIPPLRLYPPYPYFPDIRPRAPPAPYLPQFSD